jgi:hypothetical protein
LLVTVIDPVACPAVVGSKRTSRVSDCPGFSVTGKVAPDTVKPSPVTVAELIVSAADPEDVSVTVSVVGESTFTSPKLRLVVLTPRAGACATSCTAKTFAMPPDVAVTLAVSVDVTAVAVAVKNAVMAPAGTVTVAGTVKAVLLLDTVTASPPAGAAAVSVTVQASLPAPVIVPLWQNSALNVPAAASPVPLRLTVAVPFVGALLTTVNDPVAAPAVVGSNFTCTVTALPGFRVTGKVWPAMENPAPAAVAELIVKAAVPEETSVTYCGVAEVFTVTSPNDRLLVLTLRAAVPVLTGCGFSCKAKVAELVPTLAVIVAF